MADPCRILIVDDNALLRALLVQLLEEAGYVALSADTGEAALEVICFNPPDLCLVDQVMPGMTGAELIRVLRASPEARLRAIPCIGVTGYDRADAELLAAGAAAALRKPLHDEPLLAAIRAVLLATGRAPASLVRDAGVTAAV